MRVTLDMDAVVLAVAHKEFCKYTITQVDSFFGDNTKVLLDLKGALNRNMYVEAGYLYWRL